MGTHPIFESDFDCLTEMEVSLESSSLYHPDTLAPYFQAKLNNLTVHVAPPAVCTMFELALAKCKTAGSETSPRRQFASKEAEESFKSLVENSATKFVLVKHLVESKLRPYVLDSINEGKLKNFYSQSIFQKCGVFKSMLFETFCKRESQILDCGQVTNEFNAKKMRKQLIDDCIEDIKSLEKQLPDAEAGLFLNGAQPGRVDCIVASILFLVRAERDTKVAKALIESTNLTSYLERFDQAVNRDGPSFLALTNDDSSDGKQRYWMAGLVAIFFLFVAYDHLPKRFRRS